EAITDNIINNLSRVSRLRVMSRSAVFRYHTKEADPQKAGRQLGADTVLVGKGIEKAIKHFRHAIEVDPNYALAYAGIVDCYLRPDDDTPDGRVTRSQTKGLNSASNGTGKALSGRCGAQTILTAIIPAHQSYAGYRVSQRIYEFRI